MKLFEIKRRPTTTDQQDQQKTNTFSDDFFDPKFNAPEKSKDKPATKPNVASGQETRRKTSSVSLPPEAHGKLSDLHRSGIEDEMSDDEARQHAGITNVDHEDHIDGTTTKGVDSEIEHLPKTPENLPAIINKQIAEKEPITPEWSMVKHLPGYLQSPIRAMGRAVFKAFTTTPIEDINVLAHVGGQGPNSNHEVNAAAGWIVQHGHPITDANLDFAESMPGYDADVKLFHAVGYAFLLVKDFAGHYIYSWPLSDHKSLKGQKRLSN